MDESPHKTPVVFYRTSNGTEVVRDWLRRLNPADRNIIGQDLMRVQFRWSIGMPLCRPLGEGLWEVRSGRELLLLRGHAGRVRAVAFHPNGRWLASSSQQPGEVKVWDLTASSQEYTAMPGAGDGLAFTAGLQRLPPRQRAVLVLRYFLDLPEAEVAAAMKCSLGTVKSTASRALARLEQLMRSANDTRSITT